ncbi:MAG: type II toxin-antitoxin system VapC family toxin [Campylobacterota bacterium]|nr:type II toxin-antitoxin system VapC family toxin [Campylobacterota bacterium]
MYLLDTNSIVYFFKGMGEVSKNLFSHSPKDIFIPSIVLYELEVGIAKSNNSKKRKEQLSLLLEEIQIIDFCEKEAKESAIIRAALEKLGTPIGPMDTLIAGCAKANNLTLVTNNTKEFKRVDDLIIVDWF